MALTKHKVAGIYSDRDGAREGARALREAGFSEAEITFADREDWQSAFTDPEMIDRRSRNGVLLAAAAGAAIGATGIGALVAAQVGAIAAAPTLSLFAGGAVGAIFGTGIARVSLRSAHEPNFRDMVREAVEKGQCAVIVRSSTEASALEAQDVIARTTRKTLDQYGSATS